MAHAVDARSDDTPRIGAATRIMLRPLGSSLPLGFFAFTMGSVLLTAVELQWVPLAQVKTLMVLSLAFVAPLELLSGVLAFLARDSGAGTSLSALGCAWTANALVTLLGPPGQRTTALGIFLLTLAALMLAFAAPAVTGKPVFGILLLIGACRFGVTGAYQVAGGAGLQEAAGWLGLVLAGFAIYGGLALLVEDNMQRTVLPIGRVGRSRRALDGDLGHQIDRTEAEAGVRRLL